MGWEQRRNSTYYYRKRRIGDRVVSEYLGTGNYIEAIAQLEMLTRERGRMEIWDENAKLEADLAIDRELDAVGDIVRELASAVLLTNGYHTHRRQWRRAR